MIFAQIGRPRRQGGLTDAVLQLFQHNHARRFGKLWPERGATGKNAKQVGRLWRLVLMVKDGGHRRQPRLDFVEMHGLDRDARPLNEIVTFAFKMRIEL